MTRANSAIEVSNCWISHLIKSEVTTDYVIVVRRNAYVGFVIRSIEVDAVPARREVDLIKSLLFRVGILDRASVIDAHDDDSFLGEVRVVLGPIPLANKRYPIDDVIKMTYLL